MYGSSYNDLEEDSSPGGEDWTPGKTAQHKSLRHFQEELEEQGIKLSTCKIRKILITGDVYSTKLSRAVAMEYEKFSLLPRKERLEKTAKAIGMSTSTVITYLPYQRQVYNEEPSENAKTIKKWRAKKTANTNGNQGS